MVCIQKSDMNGPYMSGYTGMRKGREKTEEGGIAVAIRRIRLAHDRTPRKLIVPDIRTQRRIHIRGTLRACIRLGSTWACPVIRRDCVSHGIGVRDNRIEGRPSVVGEHPEGIPP